jgi:hypothetical protein
MIRIVLGLIMLAQCTGALELPRRAQRLPLKKKDIVLKSPAAYAQRFLRMDPKTGKEINYDPKPHVVLLDRKSGAYALKWIGYDHKQKTIVYHRPDAIDVVISASVRRHSSGDYEYTYTVHNLPTSGQNVEGFAVQDFAADVRPLPLAEVHVGPMSNTIREMKEGNWHDFAVLGTPRGIPPGRRFEHQLLSPSPPGLVECRAVGTLGMKGVGEEPPQELEGILPGYEIWPSGYTIGPVEQLKSSTLPKRAKYIRKRLAHFQQLGWIVAELVPWYQQNLVGTNLQPVIKRATGDFNGGRITSELLALIESLT